MVNKPPTLKDVAERAGVSSMAVSAVVNNTHSTVRLSESTRQRIFRAMSELQYRPDMTARSLRLQRTDTIGFYNGHGYIDMSDRYAPTMFMGLQSAVASFHNHLLLYNGFHLQPEGAIVRKLLGNKADGVVIWPAPADESVIRKVGETQKPVIQLVDAYPGVASVVTDDYDKARALAEYLSDKGHSRILFRRGFVPLSTEVTRHRAFLDVAAERGMTVIATMPLDRLDRLTEFERSLISRNRESEGVTAVACWHDLSAVQVVRFLDEQGIRVPDDIALTGFDGFDWAEFAESRPLTTVAVDWRGIAVSSVELLMESIQGHQIAERTTIPGSLRIGATT